MNGKSLAGRVCVLWLMMGAVVLAAPAFDAKQNASLAAEGRKMVDLMQNNHVTGRFFSEIKGTDLLEQIFRTYDPSFLFLSKADRENLKARFGRNLKSLYLFTGDPTPAYEIHSLLIRRIEKREAWVRTWLSKPAQEFPGETSRRLKAPLPGETELDAYWQRWLSSHALAWQAAGLSPEEASSRTLSRISDWFENLRKLDPLEIRAAYYDAVLRTFDAHSGYFSPDSAREYRDRMEGSAIGPGIRVDRIRKKLIITEIDPASPAELEGSVFLGDEVLEISDPATGISVSASDTLSKVYRLLSGADGSLVNLRIRSEGSDASKEVSLTRKRLVRPIDLCYGTTVTWAAPDGPQQRALVIHLPSFYSAELGQLGGAADDLRELINHHGTSDATQNHLWDAVILDLRGNGGGSMKEALRVAELFLPPSIIVRVGDSRGATEALRTTAVPIFEGPLAVLVDSRSASASELLAASLQDNRRAWILGGPKTFGKGTVQQYLDLNQFRAESQPKDPEWGTLRLTTNLFLRPGGEAIQHIGVLADLPFADLDEAVSAREETIPYALPAQNYRVLEAAPHVSDVRSSPTALTDEKGMYERGENGWSIWKESLRLANENSRDEADPLTVKEIRERQNLLRSAWRDLTQEISLWRESTSLRAKRIQLSRVNAVQELHSSHWKANLSANTLNSLLIRCRWRMFYLGANHEVQEVDLRGLNYTASVNKTDDLLSAIRAEIPEARTEEIERLLMRARLIDDWSLGELDALGLDLWPAQPANVRLRAIETCLLKLAQFEEPVREHPLVVDLPIHAAMRVMLPTSFPTTFR